MVLVKRGRMAKMIADKIRLLADEAINRFFDFAQNGVCEIWVNDLFT